MNFTNKQNKISIFNLKDEPGPIADAGSFPNIISCENDHVESKMIYNAHKDLYFSWSSVLPSTFD